jgi:predicted transcriptional regulator
MKAKEIMEKDFPLVDSSISIDEAIKKLDDKHEGCIVLKNGCLHTVLGYRDLIEGWLHRKRHKENIEKLGIQNNFRVVWPNTGTSKILQLMRDTDFLVVRDNKKIIGLITKRDITKTPALLESYFKKF